MDADSLVKNNVFFIFLIKIFKKMWRFPENSTVRQTLVENKS
jgi:hypothetical protein